MTAIHNAITALQRDQATEGYWWYTLEANETIGAEYIFLEHCLGARSPGVWERLATRMLSQQNPDGGWSLAYGLPSDVSTTLECYVALRMTGYEAEAPALLKARECIEGLGGLAMARVFTQTHFACLGLVPWSVPPSMPIEIMLLPSWAPFSIYSFSSWARACTIPLLIIMHKQPVWPVEIPDLFYELPRGNPKLRKGEKRDMYGKFFMWVDRIMKVTGPLTGKRPTKGLALKRSTEWIQAHISRTEDIFPAMSYAALAFRALGRSTSKDPTIVKALSGLRRFQQSYQGDLPARPFNNVEEGDYHQGIRVREEDSEIHQQCCISPVWDTPWAMTALQAAGVPSGDPGLLKAARWLLGKQINNFYGDWAKKNPEGIPGGWSFEFENPDFPDIDDTIQVLIALQGTDLPPKEINVASKRAIDWCLSMQNDDGGWAAFDKNNSFYLLNKIPFADHGACLDPSSPDITGRMLQVLALRGHMLEETPVQAALAYLQQTQEKDGSWFGRWGVNFIYGTWSALTGLTDIGWSTERAEIQRAAAWLEQVQNADGGFGECVTSYDEHVFVPGPSTASQTGWGLMGLIAAGRANSPAATAAVQWLSTNQQPDGTWDERLYTGTGFPGHFYIRYHGYRYYFPLLAMGLYQQAVGTLPKNLRQETVA